MYIGPWQEFKLARILQIKEKMDKEAEEDNKRCELEVMELLGYFPEWEAVTREWDDIELDDWTHEKHCLFKEALEWFASKQCFMATWSW
jgi:hypothetical protein